MVRRPAAVIISEQILFQKDPNTREGFYATFNPLECVNLERRSERFGWLDIKPLTWVICSGIQRLGDCVIPPDCLSHRLHTSALNQSTDVSRSV